MTGNYHVQFYKRGQKQKAGFILFSKEKGEKQ
jgi:hypothetical protein